MANFVYPTNSELQQLAQDKFPRMMDNRLGFEICPARNSNAALVEWEQEDNWTGLMALRGYENSPKRVKRVGMKKYQLLPGVYGEFILLAETELTLRRQYGSYNAPIDVEDLVLRAQDRIFERQRDRIEWIIWQLLSFGAYMIPTEDGAVIHTDNYALSTFLSGTPWSNAGAATPLADLRAIQLLNRGHSVDFGASAMLIMNRVTANTLLANTNATDLGGKRTQGLSNLLSIMQVNQLLTGEGLPNIVIYDEGYLVDGTGAFVPFIPNNRAIVVGRRPNNQPVMDFVLTRNANNPDLAPGPYSKVIDAGERKVARTIEIHGGFNGGMRVLYPSAVITMTV